MTPCPPNTSIARVLALFPIGLLLTQLSLVRPAIGQDAAVAEPTAQATEKPVSKPGDSAWKQMTFKPSESKSGWEACEFGGDGKVDWKGESVILATGQPMTGIRNTGEFPKDLFEVIFNARRVNGDDFFVGFTFPVVKEHCSLILGGWSGSISGLSNVNGYDASENPTTFFQEFKNGQWYRVRLLVTSEKIQAWVDDKQVVDRDREGTRFGVRLEMNPSLPLGFACYRCTAEIRGFEYREFPVEPGR